MDQVLQLAAFSNTDAPSRGYSDGNEAFAEGKAAMYMQGPWGLGEVAKANPDTPLGTFPLPATDNADETKVRVNLDLALSIPNGAANPDLGKQFLTYLMTPEVIGKYNTDNLAFAPVKNAAPVTDDRIAGLQPYMTAAKFYQGAGTYIPSSIPLANYLQEALFSNNSAGLLQKLDDDWRRLAKRTSA
jgi:raffinose/stachyose/melibiose transport system substrate-binding protein